jgi:hypothetical protein
MKRVSCRYRIQTRTSARASTRIEPTRERKAGRPRNNWRRVILSEVREKRWSRDDLRRMANNRVRWKSAVEALCSQRSYRNYDDDDEDDNDYRIKTAITYLSS